MSSATATRAASVLRPSTCAGEKPALERVSATTIAPERLPSFWSGTAHAAASRVASLRWPVSPIITLGPPWASARELERAADRGLGDGARVRGPRERAGHNQQLRELPVVLVHAGHGVAGESSQRQERHQREHADPDDTADYGSGSVVLAGEARKHVLTRDQDQCDERDDRAEEIGREDRAVELLREEGLQAMGLVHGPLRHAQGGGVDIGLDSVPLEPLVRGYPSLGRELVSNRTQKSGFGGLG